MRVHNSTRYAAIAALIGGLACAGNKARTAETTPDQAAAAKDSTTTSRDTVGQTENPPGYRGMERDTTMVPPTGQTPSDTFLQKQGQGTPQDTSGYSGIERDTTHAAPTTDSTAVRSPDSTSMSRSGDTTGYHPSQQAGDSTAR